MEKVQKMCSKNENDVMDERKYTKDRIKNDCVGKILEVS